jgi:hypothetical protein
MAVANMTVSFCYCLDTVDKFGTPFRNVSNLYKYDGGKKPACNAKPPQKTTDGTYIKIFSKPPGKGY